MRAFLCNQLSDHWWDLRRGLPTASDFDKVFTGTGQVSGQQDAYIKQLVEDAQGLNPPAFTDRGRIGSAAMEHGRATEPEARAYYALRANVKVHQVGFVRLGDFGCSPDGLVNPKSHRHGRDDQGRRWLDCHADGSLELKCPMPETQERYLKQGHDKLPTCYRPQVHGHLIVCDTPFCDFLSYCKDMDPVYVRVYPDDYTQELRKELCRFVAKLRDALRDSKVPATI